MTAPSASVTLRANIVAEGDGFIVVSRRPGEVTLKLKGIDDSGRRIVGKPFTGPIEIRFKADTFSGAEKPDHAVVTVSVD